MGVGNERKVLRPAGARAKRIHEHKVHPDKLRVASQNEGNVEEASEKKQSESKKVRQSTNKSEQSKQTSNDS